jgi:phosphotransferase system enzyme I (PtsI)
MKSEKTYKGIPITYGVAIGRASVIKHEGVYIPRRHIAREEIGKEISRYRDALSRLHAYINSVKNEFVSILGKEHLRLLDSYSMVVNDPIITKNVVNVIRKKNVVAEWALEMCINDVIRALDEINDPFFQERKSDIISLFHKILQYLNPGEKLLKLGDIKENTILILDKLDPTEIKYFYNQNIAGLVIEEGSLTSHLTILARSFNVPAVIGVRNITSESNDGDEVIVDSDEGTVIVQPHEESAKLYEKKRRKYIEQCEELKKYRELFSVTVDSYRVPLLANIEIPEEVSSAIFWGCEGIGLYRTEYLYLQKDDFPTEEEQYEKYKEIVKIIYPYPVVIRTLDLGGDKLWKKLKTSLKVEFSEENPFLGIRSIRFSLKYPEIFKTQLRAILRAAKHGRVKLLFPMVTSYQEVRKIKSTLLECIEELKLHNVEFERDVEIGIMVEVPAVIHILEHVIKEIDFVSIGTNDLVQYLLAVDRTNEAIADLYDPLHPSVLQAIYRVCNITHSENKKVTVCGEIASVPSYAKLLIGLGVDELSVAPLSIPLVKKAIREVNRKEAQEIAVKALSMKSSDEIKEFLFKGIEI